MKQKSTASNSQVRATAIIWGCSVAMLGICIPLVAVTNSGIILPLLVMLGASAGTAAVWLAPSKRQPDQVYLTQTMQRLKERVMTLEEIYTSLPDTAKPFVISEAEDR